MSLECPFVVSFGIFPLNLVLVASFVVIVICHRQDLRRKVFAKDYIPYLHICAMKALFPLHGHVQTFDTLLGVGALTLCCMCSRN